MNETEAGSIDFRSVGERCEHLAYLFDDGSWLPDFLGSLHHRGFGLRRVSLGQALHDISQLVGSAALRLSAPAEHPVDRAGAPALPYDPSWAVSLSDGFIGELDSVGLTRKPPPQVPATPGTSP